MHINNIEISGWLYIVHYDHEFESRIYYKANDIIKPNNIPRELIKQLCPKRVANPITHYIKLDDIAKYDNTSFFENLFKQGYEYDEYITITIR